MYDVIVVGARCAGATLGMLLARYGHTVLVVDRATFPSDKPLSTHLVHPPAIRRLREWGLLDELVASNCPPIREYGLKVSDVDLMAPLPPDRDVAVAYAPRRYVLDEILVRAAVKSGAEIRENTSVTGLVTDDDGTVVGVTGRSAGTTFTERARLVVGADGTNSKVAQWVGAHKYDEKPTRLTSIWTYWTGTSVTEVPTWRDADNYAFAWPTNDGAVLAGMAWRSADFEALDRSDPEALYRRAFRRMAPELAAELDTGERVGRWMSGSVPNFFRESFGPGWALVGDAGYSRDPATASGITDALRGADILAECVDRALRGQRPMSTELAAYERRRNRASRPYYEYTCDFARLDPYPRDVLQLLGAAVGEPRHATALTGLFAQTFSPLDFFSADYIGQILTGPASASLTDWRLRMLKLVAGSLAPRSRRAGTVAQTMLNSRLGEFGRYLRHAGSDYGRWRDIDGWHIDETGDVNVRSDR
nr:NAD(P)/FAD-dependent oxidoreductase [Micromonospora sp. DSM 115978]